MINILNKNKTYITLIGFTLAEVLITLGVIGIIAAMTMPALTHKYRHKAAITQIKKMYTVLSQAMLLSCPDGTYSSLTFYDNDVKGWYINYLKPHLKISKECFNTKGCWNSSTKYMNGTIASSGNGVGSGFVAFNTIDGYFINMDGYMEKDHDYVEQVFGVNTQGDSLIVHVDINGNGKPNIIGKDVFIFVFSNKGFVPACKIKNDTQIKQDCSPQGKGICCLEQSIRNGWEIDKKNLW